LKSTEKKEEGGKKKLQKVHEFLIGLELSVTLHYLPLKLLFLKRYIYIYILFFQFNLKKIIGISSINSASIDCLHQQKIFFCPIQ